MPIIRSPRGRESSRHVLHVARLAVRLQRSRTAHRCEDDGDSPRQAPSDLHHEPQQRDPRNGSRQPIDRSIVAGIDKVPENIRMVVQNNGGGHANHSLFWTIMGPGAGGEPSGPLADAITSDVGGFAKFKEDFTKAALTRFGSGWAWLSVNKDGKLVVESTPNQDSPLMHGNTPILASTCGNTLYLNYQNRRPDYVGEFFNVINWKAVAERRRREEVNFVDRRRRSASRARGLTSPRAFLLSACSLRRPLVAIFTNAGVDFAFIAAHRLVWTSAGSLLISRPTTRRRFRKPSAFRRELCDSAALAVHIQPLLGRRARMLGRRDTSGSSRSFFLAPTRAARSARQGRRDFGSLLGARHLRKDASSHASVSCGDFRDFLFAYVVLFGMHVDRARWPKMWPFSTAKNGTPPGSTYSNTPPTGLANATPSGSAGGPAMPSPEQRRRRWPTATARARRRAQPPTQIPTRWLHGRRRRALRRRPTEPRHFLRGDARFVRSRDPRGRDAEPLRRRVRGR